MNRETLITHRLIMVIFQMTLHVRRPSSITVTTSAVRLTSQMIKLTSLSMMLTCHTVNSSLMNTAAVKTLPYKFNGKQVDEETGLYYYGAR